MARTKKKLSELKQIDGRVFEPKTITTSTNASKKVNATTLEQVWGDSGLWKYGTMDVEEYKKSLSEMNAADMRNHATKLGYMPVENIERLKNRLVTEFTRFVGSFNKPDSIGAVTNGKPVSKEVLDILGEAK